MRLGELPSRLTTTARFVHADPCQFTVRGQQPPSARAPPQAMTRNNVFEQVPVAAQTVQHLPRRRLAIPQGRVSQLVNPTMSTVE